jgi:hypothetical protein
MYVYYNDGSSSQWVSAIGGLASQQGTEGQLLIHDGSEWIPTDGVSRNLIYNGAMQVAQRGTTFTVSNNSLVYTTDRWRVQSFNSGAAVYTASIEEDAPDSFTKSLKVACSTTEASQDINQQVSLEQLIETQDTNGLKYFTSEADTVTLSFYVKSNTAATYGLNFKISDNNSAHNSTGTRIYPTSYSISSADTWEKKTIQVPLDTFAGTKSNDSGFGMGAIFFMGAGTARTAIEPEVWRGNPNAASSDMTEYNFASSTSNYWQITGVQLETGTVATPFKHKSYGQELAECQRYYINALQTSNIENNIAFWALTASGLIGSMSYAVPMRATPTIRVRANFSAAFGTVRRTSTGDVSTGLAASNIGLYSFGFLAGGSRTSGQFYDFAYDADAEL